MQTQAPTQQHSEVVSYRPTYLSHITQIYGDGRADLSVRVYLPQVVGDPMPGPGDLQVRVGIWRWRNLHPPQGDQEYWSLELEKVRPGTALRFRLRDRRGRWRQIAPLADLERVYQVFYVPDLLYSWQQDPPSFNRAKVLMETTLEGLLAGYEGGIFAPRSREEMFLDPIVREILRTDIPNRLAELGIDQIMVTTTSAVADRSYLNPRFNYLTFDVADLDWQLGHSSDLLRFLDVLYKNGLSLVPDLTFAHQVRTPFEGSLDQVDEAQAAEKRFVDDQAYMVRDFGTWMFKLEDRILRRQIIEKIVAFVVRYRFRLIRLGYLDGLLLQYSNRETNYGEIFLKELRAELHRISPETRILGEAFQTQELAPLKQCIDIFYASYGFTFLEEICRPPNLRSQPLAPEFDPLIPALQQAITCQRQNAVYAQLHDEIVEHNNTYSCESRPDTPWAYGGNPAELAKTQGEQLIKQGLLAPEDLLDYVRRTVRLTESLTLFCANLMYMFVPGVDSLMLGSLETPGNWKFYWDDVAAEQLEFWRQMGLSDREIYLLHKQHRLDMARLRQIFRDYTYVEPDPLTYTLKPTTQVHLHYHDAERSLIALWRLNPSRSAESLLILFNLGPQAFKQETHLISLPVPAGFDQDWEVLFAGDWIDPLLRTSEDRYYLDQNVDVATYSPGTILPSEKQSGHPVVSVEIGSFSLIILKVSPSIDLSVDQSTKG